MTASSHPYLSIVIPIYNEEESLPALCDRLFPALDQLGHTYEVIFVNDGSSDTSIDHLAQAYQKKTDQVRVVDLTYNVGQYMALMAGISHARGEITITLDADLQNPPEEIGKLVAKIEEGYDLVGSYRADRQDTFFRRMVSRWVNIVREKLTGLKMRDHGCMLRAYRRPIVDAMNVTQDPTIFINALAQRFAGNSIDIEVRHEPRHSGTSRYNLFQLSRLFFDLITGFSLVPIQIFTGVGFFASFCSLILVVILVGRRIFLGPEVEGVFTLFAILFFLISITIVGIGLVGEYVGRIYLAAVKRPRYLVRQVIESSQESKPTQKKKK